MADIAETLRQQIGGEVVVRGDGDIPIQGIAPIDRAGEGEITHLSSPAYRRHLAGTGASAVLLSAGDADGCPCTAVVVANPYLAFAVVSQLFEQRPQLEPGIDPRAEVHPEAEIHADVRVGAFATVGAGAVLDAGVQVGQGALIGERSRIGARGDIRPRATIHHDVRMGEDCVVHSGAVIGADGFGFTPHADGRWQAIAQLGGVLIGDDVSIGANTAIDRGALQDTIIGNGVKIDNLVQIGHNCEIGDHTLICGCVGIVGSTKIGRHCVFAGGAGVGGAAPIEICDNVMVSVVTTITQSITEPGIYSSGTLHNLTSRWKRNAIRFQNLDDLARRVSRLESPQPGGARGASPRERSLQPGGARGASPRERSLQPGGARGAAPSESGDLTKDGRHADGH
ncbi:MAG: UDP-3-O-(3-hydroxymyristoyl)glucosamine N-acyltransferase [Gammaproteobacteria bacterium]|nr:UDP-3-O-(3-hydroxymyristoyl)glucosamine N-acyltransferase [Gammaproteobacteria bacterium]